MPKRTSIQTLIADLTRIEALAATWRKELTRAARPERATIGAEAAVISGGVQPGVSGAKCPPKPGTKKKSTKKAGRSKKTRGKP